MTIDCLGRSNTATSPAASCSIQISGAVQVPELVAVSNATCQKRLQLASLMLDVNLCCGLPPNEDPYSSRKDGESDVRLANDGVATCIALLVINRIKVVCYNQIGIRPNIGGRSIAVVFRLNSILKASVALPVNFQGRSLESVRSFIKINERAYRKSSLDFHLLDRVLHSNQLERVDDRYGNTDEQGPSGDFRIWRLMELLFHDCLVIVFSGPLAQRCSSRLVVLNGRAMDIVPLCLRKSIFELCSTAPQNAARSAREEGGALRPSLSLLPRLTLTPLAIPPKMARSAVPPKAVAARRLVHDRSNRLPLSDH